MRLQHVYKWLQIAIITFFCNTGPFFINLSTKHMKIEIKTNKAIRDFRHLFEPLNERQSKAAVSRSLNRAADSARTRAKREISAVYNISVSRADAEMKVERSSNSTLTARIKAVSNRTPFDAFKPRLITGSSSHQFTTSKGNRILRTKSVRRPQSVGLQVTILRGQQQVIHSAFMVNNKFFAARGKYNKNGGLYDFIFRKERVNKKGSDLPISTLSTASVYTQFRNPDVSKRITAHAEQVLYDRLKHELLKGLKYSR